MGAGVMGFGGVEFFAEVGDEAVEFDAEFACGLIGAEVDGRLQEAAHEAAGVVTAAEGFAGEVDEGGFAAVGDEFDGVDEVFAPGAKLLDALVEREMRCVGL